MKGSYITFLRTREQEMLEIYKAVLVQMKKDKIHKNHRDAIKIIIKGHEQIITDLKEQEVLDAI